MGIVEKQYYKRQTARLTAPVKIAVQLDHQAVYDIGVKVAEAFVPEVTFMGAIRKRDHRFGYTPQDDGSLLIVCFEGTNRKWYWQASLKTLTNPEPPDSSIAVLQLAYWKTTQEKEMVRKQSYEELREQLFVALRTADPTAKLLVAEDA